VRICSHSHANAYVNGVEKLAKIEAPPRAQTIPSSRLPGADPQPLSLARCRGHEAGFETLLMYSCVTEIVMDILSS